MLRVAWLDESTQRQAGHLMGNRQQKGHLDVLYDHMYEMRTAVEIREASTSRDDAELPRLPSAIPT